MKILCKFYFNFFLHDIVEVFKESTAVVTASARVDVYSYFSCAWKIFKEFTLRGVVRKRNEYADVKNSC
jgi:hypothetical protein